jgi:hypothetical protein
VTLVSQRDTDIQMLREVLAEDSLTITERDAFVGMLDDLDEFNCLTAPRREWLTRTHQRFHPVYENLVSSGQVPRGREVPEPAALQFKPKRPPGR